MSNQMFHSINLHILLLTQALRYITFDVASRNALARYQPEAEHTHTHTQIRNLSKDLGRHREGHLSEKIRETLPKII